jgi:methyltransferase (TIGR00027 family)
VSRVDGDSWDLASSVGATATMVAAARALATADPQQLINDPFADPLVRAVGVEFFVKMIDGTLDLSQFPDHSPERTQAMIDGMALRTRFFDEFLLGATAAGIRQVVILAAGLDSRAYRLTWPEDTIVYEIDQPEVIAFKSETLSGLGAQPTTSRRTVAIDLREDWPAALAAAGFDRSAPTAWLAEGLLIYLPSEAQDRLFDTITGLSAPGSAVATEYAPGIEDFDAARSRQFSDTLREHGLDLDMSSLVYTGQRSHVLDYLHEKGWQVTGSPRSELFTAAGLPVPPPTEQDQLGEIVYVNAQLR